MKVTSWFVGTAVAAFVAAAPAGAQTRPHHSGHMSFNAPQMHPDRSGFHRPNRPTHHHFYGHPGYKPAHRAEL